MVEDGVYLLVAANQEKFSIGTLAVPYVFDIDWEGSYFISTHCNNQATVAKSLNTLFSTTCGEHYQPDWFEIHLLDKAITLMKELNFNVVKDISSLMSIKTDEVFTDTQLEKINEAIINELISELESLRPLSIEHADKWILEDKNSQSVFVLSFSTEPEDYSKALSINSKSCLRIKRSTMKFIIDTHRGGRLHLFFKCSPIGLPCYDQPIKRLQEFFFKEINIDNQKEF